MSTTADKFAEALRRDRPGTDDFMEGEFRCRVFRGLQAAADGFTWQVWDLKGNCCFASGSSSTRQGAVDAARAAAERMRRDEREDGERFDGMS